MRRGRLRHRQPGDLMAEPQPSAIPGQQPGRENLIHGRRRASRHRLNQPQITAGADQRRDIQHLAGLAAQPRRARQHRVARRRRDLAHPGLQHFGHIERVSARQPVQLGRVKAARAGQPPHRVRGQRRQLNPPGRPLPGKLTKSGTKRVSSGQVLVTVGHKQQHRSVPDSPAQEPQQVNGRLIGPVDVLHNHHVQRPRFADLAQQSTEQLIAASRGTAQVQQLPAKLISDIKQRPERARGEQPSARPPGPARIRQVTLKLLHQRRLADTRLPRHQHQPPVALPCLPRIPSQRRQCQFPFQQPHT